MRLGVLISGRGSNLEALLKAHAAGKLPAADFAVVVANDPQAPGLDIARAHGIQTAAIAHRGFPGGRQAHDAAVAHTLKEHGVEAVVLAGYMRIIGQAMLEAFPHRIVNIHPSLLPSFPGLHAQEQALAGGVRVSGCTVHFVDEGVDSGPIIVQKTVPVLDDDDAETLSARILVQEHLAIVEAVDLLSRGALRIENRRVRRME